MMIVFYVLVFVFDLVLLALLLLVFAEKRRVRRDVSRLLDAESSVGELMNSMEQLIDEYKRAASEIEKEIRERRNQLVQVVHRADRLLMELVRRSDKFELAQQPPAAAESAAQPASTGPKPSPGRRPGAAPFVVPADGKKAALGAPKEAKTAARRWPPEPIVSDAKVVTKPLAMPSEREATALRQALGTKPAQQDKPEQQPGTTDEAKMAKTKRLVEELSKQGLDVETIARSLRVPVGEVKLILDVMKSKSANEE